MRILAVALLLGAGLLSDAPADAEIVMPLSVNASGGGESTNPTYRVQHTVGLATIGRITNPLYLAEIGFIPPWVWTTVDTEEAERVIPTEFWLGQNYPNPFNPTTTLEFAVPGRSHVSLKLYDVSGREVRTLVDRGMDPGFYKIVLRATNLASGIYYCRMSAGDYVSTKRLVLVK